MEAIFDCMIVTIVMIALVLYLGVVMTNVVVLELKKLFKSLFS